MDKFKIRCSAISQIMSEPRSKADKEAGKLSETTKSYVHQWLTESIYGIRKQLDTKQINKGLEMEDEAIAVLQEYHNNKYFMLKNESFFNNEWVTGTPDVITNEMIFDTKCSWDAFSFPLFDEKLNPAYYWQMQGYMWLTERNQAKVAYVLVNTPEHLQFSTTDLYDYTKLPLSRRVKEYLVDYDQEAIEKIKERVEQIRNYIKQLNIK